jgi:NAD(P)-dependent dehydrogenase (short-subunit alcohol dehydrogenase family)
VTRIAGGVAVITGGARGIGLATAEALARRGARLVLVDFDEQVEQAAADLSARGIEAIAVRADVRRDDAFAQVRERALDRFGAVDILMNNAGVLASGRFEDTPIDEWQRTLDVNVVALVRAIQCFLPDLRAGGQGHVVNTASFAGLFPYAHDRIAYAASKGAVVTMTESLALYLEPMGIGVTLLCPGPVSTGIGTRSTAHSPGLKLRGPGSQFAFRDPAEVGEMVAEAIETDRFFLPTDPLVEALLRERAADMGAFVRKQTAALDA